MKNKKQKNLSQHIIWRKVVPFIPILGIPFTMIYDFRYGDTGIEKDIPSIISILIHGISLGFILHIT